MPIDFTAVLKDLDNKPIRDELAMVTNGGKPVDLTLGRAASAALFAGSQGDVSGEDKFKWASLAVEIRDAKAATLSLEDLALIKTKIGILYGGLVVLRAWPLLDEKLTAKKGKP